MHIALLLLLAQVGSPNSALRVKDVFTPTGSVTTDLYVQPDGGVDQPVCTLAKPCKTLQYTWDTMVPPVVQGGATININLLDGTYNETGLRLGGKNLVAAKGLQPTLNLQGITPMSAATGLATGSTSVTQTAYTASSGVTPASVTDSSGTWTVNDLRGKFLTALTGARAGQRRIIVSNTATTITLAVGYTASPANGDTFQIDYPGAVFTQTLAITGNQGPANAAFGLNLRRLAAKTTSGNALQITTNSALQSLTDIIAEATSSFALSLRGNFGISTSSIQLSNVSVYSPSSTALSIATCSGVAVYTTAQGTGLYARTGAGAAAAVTVADCGLFGAVTLEATTGPALRLTGTGNYQMSSLPGLNRFICSSGGIGWDLSNAFALQGRIYASTASGGNASFEGCGSAVVVSSHVGMADMRGGTTTISNATNGFVATQGGRIYLGTGSITYSTVTNQTVTDGVVLTQAAIDALTPRRQCATDGSCISRE